MYVFEGPTIVRPDLRDYGTETRFVTFGHVDGRLLAVVHTWRGNVCRIISARKANKREQRAYHSALLGHAPDSAS
nr:BrnT family toxin [Azospirillum thermophilum]